eukprot:9076482-Alexandrium_andersonii.AAC.1
MRSNEEAPEIRAALASGAHALGTLSSVGQRSEKLQEKAGASALPEHFIVLHASGAGSPLGASEKRWRFRSSCEGAS